GRNSGVQNALLAVMDYGRPIQFGYFFVPDASQPLRVVDQAVRADAAGIDLIGIQDHPYQHRFHDTWTLLTAIAARTKRVTVFPDVVNLPLRPPAGMRVQCPPVRSASGLALTSRGCSRSPGAPPTAGCLPSAASRRRTWARLPLASMMPRTRRDEILRRYGECSTSAPT